MRKTLSVGQEQNTFELCPPRADAMVSSLRAFGYDLAMAIADLIDNSIFANAKNIWINYGWEDGNPWISIVDDGNGMSELRLKEAMRLGSQSPLEERVPEDLGRFGLGLKTASFSQCKVLTVHSKTNDGEISTRCWDLDHVCRTKNWELDTTAPGSAGTYLMPLESMESGTIVLWQYLDRVIDSFEGSEINPEYSFYEKFIAVKKYLEMVFHRYLTSGQNQITITIGQGTCEPWDPFLRSNSFTQELSSERYEDDRVFIKPFVLPHVSHRTADEDAIGSGLYGWNAHQGFYVYRNKRMIVPGGYLDLNLKPEEHYKLARIMVDITNDMDHEWRIDVRKAVAIPPDRLKVEFNRIAKATRQEAVRIYRTRMGQVRRSSDRDSMSTVWLKRKIGDKITYRLNSKNPILKRILGELEAKKSWIRKLFHVIEKTVPHRLIIIDNADSEDCHVDLPLEQTTPPESLLSLCEEFYHSSMETGRSHSESVDYVCALEPFDTHPAYRAHLDGLIGDSQADE